MTLPQDSLRYCRTVARKSGSTFASALSFLPREKRDAMIVLYAFMRLTDDLADAADRSVESRRLRLKEWASLVEQSFDTADQNATQTEFKSLLQVSPEVNVFPALKQVCKRFEIRRDYLLHVIDGVTCDLALQVRMKTLDETLLYCDRVAGAVGLATLAIFGCDAPLDRPEIYRAAIACGRAFQWTNFLRDIGEDLAADRVYFPLSDFESVGLSLDAFKSIPGRNDAGMIAFFHLQNERVRRFYEESEPLLDHVNRDCRDVYNLMRRRYRLLFEILRKDNFQAFSKRVRLSVLSKMKLLVPCLLGMTGLQFH